MAEKISAKNSFTDERPKSADVIAQSISEPAIGRKYTIKDSASGIEYDGIHYYRLATSNEVRSVQERLEKALSQVANEPISVLCRQN